MEHIVRGYRLPQEVLIFTLAAGSATSLSDPRRKGCCCLSCRTCLSKLSLQNFVFWTNTKQRTKYSWGEIFPASQPFNPSVTSIFYVFCCFNQTSYPFNISLLIFIPLFFSHCLYHQSDPHSSASSNPPPQISFSYLGDCPILPLSLIPPSPLLH